MSAPKPVPEGFGASVCFPKKCETSPVQFPKIARFEIHKMCHNVKLSELAQGWSAQPPDPRFGENGWESLPTKFPAMFLSRSHTQGSRDPQCGSVGGGTVPLAGRCGEGSAMRVRGGEEVPIAGRWGEGSSMRVRGFVAQSAIFISSGCVV